MHFRHYAKQQFHAPYCPPYGLRTRWRVWTALVNLEATRCYEYPPCFRGFPSTVSVCHRLPSRRFPNSGPPLPNAASSTAFRCRGLKSPSPSPWYPRIDRLGC
ncbi:hypothetical protein M758_2G135100 [Ceratodon purpureus]|nr:hypothetical protein M758_2G135100 [Ceratodon purpureus]